MPSSTLWVGADIVNVDDTAGEGVSDAHRVCTTVFTCHAVDVVDINV